MTAASAFPFSSFFRFFFIGLFSTPAACSWLSAAELPAALPNRGGVTFSCGSSVGSGVRRFLDSFGAACGSRAAFWGRFWPTAATENWSMFVEPTRMNLSCAVSILQSTIDIRNLHQGAILRINNNPLNEELYELISGVLSTVRSCDCEIIQDGSRLNADQRILCYLSDSSQQHKSKN